MSKRTCPFSHCKHPLPIYWYLPPKLHIRGDEEDEDGSDERFLFNVMGPGISMGMGGGGEAWLNWAGAEMHLSPTLIQELNTLNAPSPSPSPVPPSPIPSDHNPNIYITSPPSPSASHSHSPSHSQLSHQSQGHGHSQSHRHSHHPSVPMLSIPQYTLTPSPTSSEFSMFGQHRHVRQPSITLTPTPDVDMHRMREGDGREKRQRRMGSVEVSVGSVGSSMGGSPMISPMGGGSVSGLGGACNHARGAT
ncbi:hypothetical protein BDR05DRAFT_1004141 [Suillus weaverae]|nr:hypothetical protein BDR05DRAFT_1004141 [Suillus weaverae]